MNVTIDFSEVGVMTIAATTGGASTESLHLGELVRAGQSNATIDKDNSAFLYRSDTHTVSIYFSDRYEYTVDIRDVTSPVYATTQELIDDITAAIALMYAGGGGGSGTLTNFTFPATQYTFGSVTNPTTTPALAVLAVNGTRWYISQPAHGFAVGDLLRRDSGGYAKAQADSAANAEVAGIVVLVPDAGTFVLLMGGLLQSGMSGLTDGTTYFLSPTTAGALTATEPTAVGQVSKPVFIANSTVGGIFVNMRGMLITAPSALPFTEYRDYLSGFDGQPFSGYSYNSIGGSPAWAKIGTGIFEVTMTGLFNLTTYPQGWRSNNGAGPMCSSILSSGDVCRFEFYDNANALADPSTFFISITKYGS